MKILSSIFALYILILTVMPCVDVLRDLPVNMAELTQSKTDIHHYEYDCCSPFCTCDCCTSRVVRNDNIMQFFRSSVIIVCVTVYSSTYYSSFLINIWHPPKLV
jgi:hypothetical protein